MLVAALAGLFAFTASASAEPQPGDLDPSFGKDGLVRTQVDGRNGAAEAVAIDRHHRIVVAGSTGNAFGLARYLPNGKLDPSFSGDGMRTIRFPNADAYANAVAVGADGFIEVAGRECSESGECRFAIARLKGDGHPWRFFGRKGRVTLGFGGEYASATSMALDSGNRLTVGGSTCVQTHCDLALTRVGRNGELEHRFGTDGRTVTRIDQGNPTARAGISSLAIDSRDRIVAGGTAANKRVVLARYKKHGAMSRSFGDDGVVLKDLDRLAAINGVAVTPRDKIVAVGNDKLNFSSRWTLARFGRSGGLDSSFGDGGQVTTGIPGKRRVDPHAVAIDGRNRIVATGAPRFSLARYQPNGKLNRSFGHHGKVSKDFGFGSAEAVAIHTHNRPVVAGSAMRRFAVARFIG